MTLALLHTSPVHVPVFDALRDAGHPGLALRHLVREDLLARARESGPEAVVGEIRSTLAGAVADGARAVLCTCSTIGAVAEAESATLGVPVLRVDRPMAAAAAAHDRVVVLASITDTLVPTLALLAEEAGAGPSTYVPSWWTGPGRDSRPVTATAIWTSSRPRPTRSPTLT